MKKIICVLIALSMTFCTLTVFAGDDSAIPLDGTDAEILSSIGFLQGTENGFELEREATRAEAITMIVRVTGHEFDAMLSSAGSGFADTDLHWSFSYVGYGVRNGIVNGTSETTFEPERIVTGQEFVKMMLLALGYKDITLENAYEKGVETLLLSNDYSKNVVKDNNTLTRSDVVRICAGALLTKKADGTVLYKALIDKGLFTKDKWNSLLQETQFHISDKDFVSALNEQMPKDRNYMFSPFSIKMALAMAANGADGETKTEILKAIGIDDLDQFNAYAKDLIAKYNKADVIRLNVANSIWINTDRSEGILFNDIYKSKIAEYYNGESREVNNQNAVDTINNWVNEKTNKKIPTIIDNNEFWAALINAIYFKAEWQDQFDEVNTKKAEFTDRNNNIKEIDFMNQTSYYKYFGDDTYKIIELPYSNTSNYKIYKDLSTSMYIIMSNDKRTDIDSLIKNTKLNSTYVNLSIPKFKVEFETQLNDILKNMGILKAFDLEKADFKNMFNTGNMAVTQVIHKTFINVDENGTEAAAATAIMMAGSSAALPPELIEFKANKPFTYVIRDNISGEILFMGEYAFGTD